MAECNCVFNNNTYRFSSSAATFNKASANCKSEGGTLPTYVTKEIYEELNRCCFETKNYWIGLSRKRDCPATIGYTWENSASNCHDGSPLRIMTRTTTDCEAIVIQPEGNKQLPTALEESCSQPHRFICQFANSHITTDTSSSTTTSNATPSPQEIVGPAVYNSGVIAAVVLCCLLILILLFFLYFWKYKKYDLKKIKAFGLTRQARAPPTPATTTHSNQAHDHLYYNVHPPTEEDLEANPRPPNESNYQIITDVAVASEYQEINFSPTTSSIQQECKNSNSVKMNGVYSQLELPPDEDELAESECEQASTFKHKQTTKDSSESAESVQYTTVRTLDQPNEVYAVINKTMKHSTNQ